MKKVYYSWAEVNGAVIDIARQLQKDNWKPDYVVGITRGGLIPAVLLSQYLGVPMETLKVQLRDGGECESNLWMAEDALGCHAAPKNILIIDDINDSGATISWIKEDWPSGCYPKGTGWDLVWGGNVRFATLTNNLSSREEVDYSVFEVNKAEEDCWLVYPWEDFWK
jgi:hypothetical protein